MLRKYRGGEEVQRGTYWNFANGQRVNMTGVGVLPGDDGATYRKFSPLGLLVLGPIMGLVYAAFLPFIGIAMLLKLVAEKLIAGVLGMTGSSVSFRWRPREAYLSGKKKGRAKGKGPEEGGAGKKE
jgi:hypothetical protein